jgi:hypothetical protein
MSSTDRKLELKAKTWMAQTASQAAVYAKELTNSLTYKIQYILHFRHLLLCVVPNIFCEHVTSAILSDVYIFHPVVFHNVLQYIIHTINSLTQLVSKWQHVSAYYKAIIRPFIDLVDHVCTVCWCKWDPISLRVYS